MATFKVRVEDIIGSVSDDAALSDWLTEGARLIIRLMPEDKLERYVTAAITVIDDEDSVDISDYRPIRAHKNGYRARRIDPGLKAQAVDSASIHLATEYDPVWYIELSRAYVLPGGGTVIGIIYPTVTYSNETIANFPTELDSGVVIYSAIKGRIRQISDLYSSINSLTFNSGTLPTAPGSPSFSFTPATYTDAVYDAAVYTDVAYTDAAYTSANYNPAMAIDALIDTVTSTSISFNNTLSYVAPPFMGSYTNTDTALTSQDIELAQGHLSKVSVQLNEMQNQLSNAMNEFNKDKIIFDTAFQQATIDAQLAQQRLIEQTRLQIQLNQFNTQQALQAALTNSAQEAQIDLANERAKLELSLANKGKALETALANAVHQSQVAQTNAAQAMQLDITNRAKATELMILNASKELERQIQEFQGELSLYGQAMNGYATQIQAESTRVGIELQKINSQSQLLLSSLQELRLEFQEFLKMIGI